MRGILIFLLLLLGLGSIFVTFISIVTNSYFSEIQNIISLNDKEKYMEEDLLKITETYGRNANTSDTIRFDIEGMLQNEGVFIAISVGQSKYLDFKLNYQPVYKSKLSGDYFLKNAPEAYYNGKYRGLYAGIAFKIAFYFILAFFIIKYITYLKNRKFKI